MLRILIISWSLMTIFLGGALLLELYSNDRNKDEFILSDHKSTDNRKHQTSFVYQMMDFDLRNGIAEIDVVNQAKINVSNYFSQVQEVCDLSNKKEFVVCANEVLGQHFYYKESMELSNSYANHQSDCDLNSYLLYDVAAMSGIDISIVYAPFHAFIGWNDKKEGNVYWETTTNNNHGGVIDFDNKNLYQETSEATYYRFVDENEMRDVYYNLVYDLMLDKSYVEQFSDQQTHALIGSVYYEYLQDEGLLSQDDIDNIEVLLKADTTSIDKKMILLKWYKKNNDHPNYERVRELIKSRECYGKCVKLIVKDNKWSDYYLYEMYSSISVHLGKPERYDLYTLFARVCYSVFLLMALFFVGAALKLVKFKQRCS